MTPNPVLKAKKQEDKTRPYMTPFAVLIWAGSVLP